MTEPEPRTLVITAELRVDQSEVVPEHIGLQIRPGGFLWLGPGVTLEVRGPFSAEAVWVVRGAGRLVLGGERPREARPEWWGGSTSVEISKAIEALSTGVVALSGRYRIVGPIDLKSHVALWGAPATLEIEHQEVFRQAPGTVLQRSRVGRLRFETSSRPDALLLSLRTIQDCVFEDLSVGDLREGTFVRLLADDQRSTGRAASAAGNLFDRIDIERVHTGFDLSGTETSWMTANTFRSIHLRAVHGIGFVFRSYCDHDRFFDLTIRLSADYAVGMIFNASDEPGRFSYVYMHYFFGVTLVTNVTDTEGQIGLLFNNTRGHLFFGLSFGSSCWRGSRIVDHGALDGEGSNSYFALGTVSWDRDSLSFWRKGGRTDRSGSALVSPGATGVEVVHGLCSAPARVFLTPTSDTGGSCYWVARKSATTFCIQLNGPSNSNLSFDWRAQVDEG